MTLKKSKVTRDYRNKITVLYVDSGYSLICSHNSKFFLFPTNSVTPQNSHVVACADTVCAVNEQLKVLLLPGDVFSDSAVLLVEQGPVQFKRKC